MLSTAASSQCIPILFSLLVLVFVYVWESCVFHSSFKNKSTFFSYQQVTIETHCYCFSFKLFIFGIGQDGASSVTFSTTNVWEHLTNVMVLREFVPIPRYTYVSSEMLSALERLLIPNQSRKTVTLESKTSAFGSSLWFFPVLFECTKPESTTFQK